MKSQKTSSTTPPSLPDDTPIVVSQRLFAMTPPAKLLTDPRFGPAIRDLTRPGMMRTMAFTANSPDDLTVVLAVNVRDGRKGILPVVGVMLEEEAVPDDTPHLSVNTGVTVAAFKPLPLATPIAVSERLAELRHLLVQHPAFAAAVRDWVAGAPRLGTRARVACGAMPGGPTEVVLCLAGPGVDGLDVIVAVRPEEADADAAPDGVYTSLVLGDFLLPGEMSAVQGGPVMAIKDGDTADIEFPCPDCGAAIVFALVLIDGLMQPFGCPCGLTGRLVPEKKNHPARPGLS